MGGGKKSPAPVGLVPASKGGVKESSIDSPTPSAASMPNSHQIALAAQLLQQAQSAPGAMASQPALAAAAAQLHGMNTANSAADTLQTLASIMNSSAASKALLPNSAPVSSLLPPIPAMNAAAAPSQASISSQIASLFSHAANSAAPTTTSPVPPDPAAVAAAAQQLAAAATAAAAQTMRPAPPTTSAHPAHIMRQHSAPQVPPSAAAALSGGMVSPDMQNWSLDQLQQHVNLLEQIGQPVPQTVSLLLADAKRKADKRNAKRIANRKSASTSRARKKAYVQEMTELNARLKRQALILSLLPDMVIAIGESGDITFCSAQVERVLRFDSAELVGANLSNLLVPSSKEKLNRLIKRLLGGSPKVASAATGQVRGLKTAASATAAAEASDPGESNNTVSGGGAGSGAENSAAPAAPAAVSEPSFPLSVVQVKAKSAPNGKDGTGTGTSDDQNSDTSASNPDKQVSSLTNSNLSAQSQNAMYLGLSDEKAQKDSSGPEENAAARNPSSDLSNSSSLSTNAKNVQQANTNLERNVRWHNKKMKMEKSAFWDDVTGQDVTANNASARLSSLQHRPESSSSEEDDSGYRESNDSREETSSSVSDSSGSNGRRKPIAPTCNICLIRKDLTTIWCEVTSSIRTKEREEESCESVSGDSKKNAPSAKSSVKSPPATTAGEDKAVESVEVERELLLCLRPIRDGEHKMHDSKLRFDKKTKGKKKRSASDGAPSASAPCRPFKKRGMATEVTASSKSTNETADDAMASAEVDTDAAESLMMMNKKST
uniref:PAS domain-containing protein n=1 Tax=Entomoneis paludosa TaxID=265537 RepID=A0A7S2V9B7_9STRA|mmetsp:Transcript_10512/g.21631  ORF Transcript_10512/g.21631 Transcript_10512/m.21631 type:complete len:776 (+) Transcript_10512:379-2706(+)|eukprot:CAMPEP_0172468390 /NCGR_PEP_ID=MMETSP1065-20121228/61156_1 /TAXON_ID=265537 /ORGANISM="Amphiprora paludosa, Strain CCMP125" /LENGTH=775 /DNA_ID=CAMNT_0013225767 /DNA_START=355 /DNA_END=2682 /DNA_ORIENTATION=-